MTCGHTEQLLLGKKFVENKGALGATQGQLLSIGPESGIVDGESPSISLSYIDKTGYKCTHTCAYSVSTESVSRQLGSCLMACYLSSTKLSFSKTSQLVGRQAQW